MINVLLVGCNGRMGKVITELVKTTYSEKLNIVAGYDRNGAADGTYPVYSNLNDCTEKADVLVDFSNPVALEEILEFVKARGIPTIIATTGHTEEQRQMMKECAKYIPLLNSTTMSIGMNLVVELVKKTTKALQEDFDIEIVEKHHNQKLDAPSGVAVMLANSVRSSMPEECNYVYDRHDKREKRSKNEIGIHTVRGGNIVGDHTVIFAGQDEIIEISHIATSRNMFARGALRAAEFIVRQKPGFYGIKDLFN